MRYYVAYRSIFKSPKYKYFDSLEELNNYYGIDATEEHVNAGFSFEYKNKWYVIGCEE